MERRRHGWVVAWGAAFALFGCDGLISEPTATGGPPGSPPGVERPRCEGGAPGPAAAPARRLTPAEYRASVAAMFPSARLPAVTLLGNANPSGFENDVRGQAVSELLVESYRDAAVTIAAAAVAERGWMPCESESPECLDMIVAQLAGRAYRRPPTEDERATLVAFLAREQPEWGLLGAVEMLIEALLQSPKFLYRPELGDPSLPAPAGLVALADHELATRLAFFLTGAPPDAALLALASEGALRDEAGLEREARRMLESPAAERTIATFHDEWLHLRRLEEVGLDATRFPEWGGEMSRDLRDSLTAFVQHTFWEEGTIEALFTSRTGFVNDRLAPVFGVPAPGSDELVAVELAESERAGLLTQPGLLASTSHGLSHSPILRGVLVLEAVLCLPPPPPPPEVDAVIPTERPDGTLVRTVREQVELTHGSAECQSCHEAIDGMGFSFERYDAIGRYRTEENGEVVDPTGRWRGEDVDDALALSRAFATDPEVHACLATQWYRFALGRTEEAGDACQIEALTEQLGATGGDLRELVVALVTSPAFRFRPEGER